MSGVVVAGETMGLASVTLAAGAPALSGGVGVAYEIGPDAAFDEAQRVWLPVAAGLDATQLTVYYLLDGVWYPAEQVAGLLVSTQYLQVNVGGVDYLGLVVRHGGVVQLGYAQPEDGSAAGVNGDGIVMLLLAAGLLMACRRYAVKRQA
jgi:hypothetical protein